MAEDTLRIDLPELVANALLRDRELYVSIKDLKLWLAEVELTIRASDAADKTLAGNVAETIRDVLNSVEYKP